MPKSVFNASASGTQALQSQPLPPVHRGARCCVRHCMPEAVDCIERQCLVQHHCLPPLHSSALSSMGLGAQLLSLSLPPVPCLSHSCRAEAGRRRSASQLEATPRGVDPDRTAADSLLGALSHAHRSNASACLHGSPVLAVQREIWAQVGRVPLWQKSERPYLSSEHNTSAQASSTSRVASAVVGIGAAEHNTSAQASAVVGIRAQHKRTSVLDIQGGVGIVGIVAKELDALAKAAIDYDQAFGNGKPTVVEFYADWCEICRETAPDLLKVESSFRKDINFAAINIDNPKWAAELDEFGVDGIPHFSFLDRDGNELGFMIGRFPLRLFVDNLNALASGSSELPHPSVTSEYSEASSKAPPRVDPRSHSQGS